ncbi:MAG: hypothetical protein ABIV36_12180 [Sphingobium limneticum]
MTDPDAAGSRLIRKLEQSAEIAGCTMDVVSWRSRDVTCSIFACAQHRLTVSVGGSSSRAWLETLDEHSVYVPGYVLAELAVGTIEPCGEQLLVELEAQTVKEA